jgi:Flp pilus assembly protein protease CpaA
MNTMTQPIEQSSSAPTRSVWEPILSWISAITVPLLLSFVWTFTFQTKGSFYDFWLGFQLMFLLSLATVTDLYRRKIYNWLTGSTLVVALAVNALMPSSGLPFGGVGSVGIESSAIGATVCFFIVFLAYQLSGCGAGDVKMAVAIGSILGWRIGLTAIAYSYIVAAIAAVSIMVWSIHRHRLPGPNNRPIERQLQSTIPMAPFFAIGTAIAIWETLR